MSTDRRFREVCRNSLVPDESNKDTSVDRSGSRIRASCDLRFFTVVHDIGQELVDVLSAEWMAAEQLAVPSGPLFIPPAQRAVWWVRAALFACSLTIYAERAESVRLGSNNSSRALTNRRAR